MDEVDSILIDEARTPLIISAPAEKSRTCTTVFNTVIAQLKPRPWTSPWTRSQVTVLTKKRHVAKGEKLLGVDNLYTRPTSNLHHLNQALKALSLFKRDTDYMVATTRWSSWTSSPAGS